jgi:hypothetical protein
MLSVATAAVPENKAPLAEGRGRRKFTPDNVGRIKEWVAWGVSRDEIANRLEVTVNSLQVTCSKLGISLRKRSLTNGNGTVQPLGVVQDNIRQADDPARVKFTLVIQSKNRQAAFDLPLNQDLLNQLALEASVRGQTTADLIANIVIQVIEKDVVGKILCNGNSPSKVATLGE